MKLQDVINLNPRQFRMYVVKMLTKVMSELTFFITFDLDGGTGTAEEQTLKYGSLVEEPTPPTKANHSFVGWFLDSVLWDFSKDTVADDMTLVAVFEIDTNTVTFDADGGLPAPESQVVDYGGLATKPEDPVKEGFVFESWKDGSSNVWDFDTDTVTSDVTLTAFYTSDQT